MKGDDAVRLLLREIRQTYYYAFNEWVVDDREAMLKHLLEIDIKNHDLIKLVGG